MYETLRHELYNEIYFYKLGNLSSGFEKRLGSGAFQRSSSDRMSSGRNHRAGGQLIKARKIVQLDFGNQQTTFVRPGESHYQQETTDVYISTIVDCMVLLNEVPRFVKVNF